jgi:hypothetical protein
VRSLFTVFAFPPFPLKDPAESGKTGNGERFVVSYWVFAEA